MLTLAVAAAQEAGAILRRYFRGLSAGQVREKAPHDYVSVADHEAEDRLRERLCPPGGNYGFWGEEQPADWLDRHEYIWVADPLDGTTNFIYGIPHFAVSLGLLHHRRPVLGVVYDPFKNDLFTAEQGKGAFWNGKRMSVSPVSALDGALVACGTPFRRWHGLARFQDMFKRLQPLVSDQRRLGVASLDLAYVAAGIFSAYWEEGLQPWDHTAGTVLVQEAGGWVGDFWGDNPDVRRRTYLATNGNLKEQFLEVFKEYPREG